MKRLVSLAVGLSGAFAATTARAVPDPYYGSDTLFNVTQSAIQFGVGAEAPAYVGMGSATGVAAMGTGTQQTAPMSRMFESEGTVCGATASSSSGLVVGLDAIEVLSSTTAGGTAACNGSGSGGGPGVGLAYSGTTGPGGSAVFANGNAGQNWKWVLALLLGGLDLSNPSAGQDCASQARKNLVANWSNLFQNRCANSASVCAGSISGTAVNGALWHVYRPDDASGTADVLAAVLGLSPRPSPSAVNGFGTSPYCNSLNWDRSAGNANCAHGAHDQFVGPGGVLDPQSACNGSTCGAPGSGNHRMPPAGTWGTAPNASSASLVAWDVLPTQFQDNDPIRRPCIGSTTNNRNRPGEEVCGLDGALGLVLPMVDSSWIGPPGVSGVGPYPTNACTSFLVGKAPLVFSCATRGTGTKHSGECPNGDALFGSGCMVPIDTINGTSQCISTRSTVSALQVRPLGSPDGRAYNAHFRDGTVVDGSIGYAQYPNPGGSTLDYTGAYSRIHQVETLNGGVACQLESMTDQIACLTQADPCSLGITASGGKRWYQHPYSCPTVNGVELTPCPTAANTDSLGVNEVYPTGGAVQLLGLIGEYPLARKLYFSSLVGFSNVTNTAADAAGASELVLAQYEANASNATTLTTVEGFTPLGAQTTPFGMASMPFCEDFDEQTICGASANVNACATNGAVSLPTAGTVCGNGVREAFEECDPGAPGVPSVNGGAAGCSATCRCNAVLNGSTGVCE